MSAWQVYWLLKLDDIQSLFWVIGLIALAVCFIVALVWGINYDNSNWGGGDKTQPIKNKRTRDILIFFGPISFGFMLLGTLTPSTKTMAAIYVLPHIIKGDTLDTIGNDAGDIYKLGVNRLKELLEEPTHH